jgi:hypothetical protein
MSLSEREIQRRLWIKNHNSFDILLPNYTPQDWWECDLFGVTRSGYFHEFEVKITAADFRADAEKRRKDYAAYRDGDYRGSVPVVNKHQELASRSTKGPSLFWYCVPEGMIDASEVPGWAGLQAMHPNRHWFQVVKQAPRLHLVKIDRKIVEHAFGVCYFRYWQERQRFDRLKESREVAR